MNISSYYQYKLIYINIIRLNNNKNNYYRKFETYFFDLRLTQR